MGQVSLGINGRQYEVQCDDGQESHLYQLADYVNGKVGELVSGAGQVGEARLLLMASLLIADELMEAKAEVQPGGADGETRCGRTANPSTRRWGFIWNRWLIGWRTLRSASNPHRFVRAVAARFDRPHYPSGQQ